MEHMKLPIALVMAMAAQLAGGVWWVSQQAATISSLEENVAQFASRMAVEDTVNLKRDVQESKSDIQNYGKIVMRYGKRWVLWLQHLVLLINSNKE